MENNFNSDDYIKILKYSSVGLVERFIPRNYYYNQTIYSNPNNIYDNFDYCIRRKTEFDETRFNYKISEKIKSIKVINNFKLVAVFRIK